MLDHTARWLRAQGHGYYTIGSAGHESNAAVALALRPTDPALLHYRSGGFYSARSHQLDGHDPVRDVLAGMLALADEPIAGGRHKVFGNHALNVIPQTSTIASQLPRALGVALAIARGRRLRIETPWPRDAIAVCSFGDASANHSTAQGAINAAAYAAHAGLAVPLLFLCEDNGLGISVPTPVGWVEASFSHRAGLRYEQADGSDPLDVLATTERLVDEVRRSRRPALLHLATVRYLGHAGTDVEAGYRSVADIRRDREHDPILGTARALVRSGSATPEDLIGEYATLTERTRRLALALAGRAAVAHPRRGDGAALAARRRSSRQDRGHVGRSGGACRVLSAGPPRGRGPAHPRRDDQSHARRRAGGHEAHAGVR